MLFHLVQIYPFKLGFEPILLTNGLFLGYTASPKFSLNFWCLFMLLIYFYTLIRTDAN